MMNGKAGGDTTVNVSSINLQQCCPCPGQHFAKKSSSEKKSTQEKLKQLCCTYWSKG